MKDKIPFYNIMNMFFVGAVFSIWIVLLFFDDIVNIDFNSPVLAFCQDWSVIVAAFILISLFEIGFILNRMSSITIEPILTKTKIWKKEKYSINVSEISANNATFKAMCSELVLIRTHILMYIILGIVSLFTSYKWMIFVFLGVILVFILSGYKHNKKINTIKEDYMNREKRREEENKKAPKFAD